MVAYPGDLGHVFAGRRWPLLYGDGRSVLDPADSVISTGESQGTFEPGAGCWVITELGGNTPGVGTPTTAGRSPELTIRFTASCGLMPSTSGTVTNDGCGIKWVADRVS